MTELAALADWLDRYRDAWRSNDVEQIAGLFTEDAVYRWNPFGRDEDEAKGRDAIIDAWLDEPDDPATWELDCEPLAMNGELGVARCRTHYSAQARGEEEAWHNVFLVRLTDDGRCYDFTEFYMKQPL